MKRPALLAATALLALAVWEVVVLLRARAAAPEETDWKAARATVERDVRPGDLIVFAPHWVDPVGRKHLGDLLTVHDVARMDEARYARVWELSIRDASFGLGGKVALDERHGAVRVRRFEREPADVLWDLRERGQLFEVDYQGRWCTPVRVPGRLELGSRPLGRTLAARAGLENFRARRDNRAFADVRLLIDDQEVARASVGSESGWVALTAETTPGAGKITVETRVDPERGGAPAVLPLCVAMEARR